MPVSKISSAVTSFRPLLHSMETHSCRFCGRSFSSGRSLGGHMRSHVAMSSTVNYEEQSARGHVLRKKARKSWRFGETWTKMEKEEHARKLCSKLEVQGKEQEDSWITVDDDEEDEMEIQTDGGVERRGRRRRSKRVEAISDSSSPSSPEYGALCLMLLSRGPSSVSDSFDVFKGSESDFFKIGLKKVKFFPSKSEFPLSDDDDDDDEYKKDMEFTVLESGKRSKATDNLFKRSRHECTICNRSFHSHQALGGHRATHKKDRVDTSLVSPAARGFISGRFRAHRCLICGKVFASGQALGGHKRSHLISDNAEQKNSNKDSLDLNLPAPEFGVFDSNESSDEIKFTALEKIAEV